MTTKTTPESPLRAGRTLWEIGDDLEALDALLTEMGGDVSDEEVERAIDAWLAETQEAEATKLDRYGALIRTREAAAEIQEAAAGIQEAEAKRLMERASTNRNGAKRLKERLIAYLDRTGRTKAQGQLYAFTVANNGGKLPLVTDDVDPMALPPRFRRAALVLDAPTDETLDALREQCRKLDVTLDGEAVRAALDAGENLSFARLGERGRHLRIR